MPYAFLLFKMLYRRLLIAFLVIIALALICWILLPRIGAAIPWWIPIIAFAVIVLSALFAPGLNEDDPDGPIPFRPIEDEGEGVSAADRERFG